MNEEQNTPMAPADPSGGNQAVDSDLAEIKRQALADLKPLISRIDLSPEDRFNMLIMIIRATDDKTLVEPAYEAAKGIEDETKRAKALVEVIEEIGYFAGQDSDQ